MLYLFQKGNEEFSNNISKDYTKILLDLYKTKQKFIKDLKDLMIRIDIRSPTRSKSDTDAPLFNIYAQSTRENLRKNFSETDLPVFTNDPKLTPTNPIPIPGKYVQPKVEAKYRKDNDDIRFSIRNGGKSKKITKKSKKSKVSKKSKIMLKKQNKKSIKSKK